MAKGFAKPTEFGVTATPANLFDVSQMVATYADPATEEELNAAKAARLAAPVYVIPTGRPLKVTIVYDVETVAPKLPGYLSDGTTHGSNVESSVTRMVLIQGGEGNEIMLQNGMRYTIKLHLGMQGVEVSATVGSWDDATDATDVDLTISALDLSGGITPWGNGDIDATDP